MRPPSEQTLEMLLKSFKLPTFAREYAAVGDTAAREGLTHPAYLLALARMEAHERADRRTLRLLEESRLPKEKSLASFDLSRLSPKARTSFNALKDGSFLERAEKLIGVPVDVISGQEEGRLIFLGVAKGHASNAIRRLVIDIGGGSTEFIVGRRKAKRVESLFIGCVAARSAAISRTARRWAPVISNTRFASATSSRPMRSISSTCFWKRAMASIGRFWMKGMAPQEPIILPCSSMPFLCSAKIVLPGRCTLVHAASRHDQFAREVVHVIALEDHVAQGHE